MNSVINASESTRNLGVFFDKHLDMKHHITNVCRQCYYQLRQLRVVRRALPKDIVKTLLHAFIAGRLDYCNSLFYGLPDCDIRKLQSVQNAAARLFGFLRKYDHISDTMKNSFTLAPN